MNSAIKTAIQRFRQHGSLRNRTGIRSDIQVLVARYAEDVSWTSLFPNIIIINKGKRLNELYTQQQLPNVGREGHSFYWYIYTFYDSLPEYLVCLQGNPFDHCSAILDSLYKLFTSKGAIPDFQHLADKLLITELSGCPYRKDLPMREVYHYLFGEERTQLSIPFGPGAQFIVSRERIYSRPKEFYKKIVDILEKECDPIEGHVIERFHGLVFRTPQVRVTKGDPAGQA